MSQSNDERCLFTNGRAKIYKLHSESKWRYDSESCGSYWVDEPTILYINDIIQKNKFPQGLINCAKRSLEVPSKYPNHTSFWIRSNKVQQVPEDQIIKYKLMVCGLEDYLQEPVYHSEKPYVLLKILGDRKQKKKPFSISTVSIQDRILSRICDEDELRDILLFLEEKQYLKCADANFRSGPVTSIPYKLTIKGWEAIQLHDQGAMSNKVFIATQFNWPGHEEAKRIQCMEAIEQACIDCGYEAKTVSQNHTGFITDRIIAEIKSAKFIIAELTYNNRGVYFESGLARGLSKDVFHVIREDHVNGNDDEGKKIHFDIQQVRYLKWSDPKCLREDLRSWIEATIGKYGDARRVPF